MNPSPTTPRPCDEADDEPDQPPSPRSELTVDLNDETGECSPDDLARLRAAVSTTIAIAAGDERPHEVRVRVVGDAVMSELHERHSGVSGTTDVLTFDLRADAAGPLDVDIAVCLDEARRAAEGRPHDAFDELALYALHGALHCLGYDDHSDDAYRAMHQREDEILRQAGLGARFFGERS